MIFKVGDRVEVTHPVWNMMYKNVRRGVIETIEGGECFVRPDGSDSPVIVPLHALAHVSAVDQLGEVPLFRVGQLVELAEGLWVDRDGSLAVKIKGGEYADSYKGRVVDVTVRSAIIQWEKPDAVRPYDLNRCARYFESVSAVDELASLL